MAETIWLRGEGGGLHEFDLPLDERFAVRLESGALQRVNPDGTPYFEKPKEPTAKEKLQAEAAALGLDPAGTVAELQKRIDEAKAKRLAELRVQAKELGIDESGTAEELQARVDEALAK